MDGSTRRSVALRGGATWRRSADLNQAIGSWPGPQECCCARCRAPRCAQPSSASRPWVRRAAALPETMRPSLRFETLACHQPAPADSRPPLPQVLALTAELQQLGGGDVSVGSAWAGAALGAAAAAASGQLDAAAGDWPSLTSALAAELRPWLQRGFGAAALLLGGSAGSAASLAAAACAGTLGAAGRVGVSWQLLSGGVVRDPWGRRQQLPGAGGSRRPSAAPRPISRLAGRDAPTVAAGGAEDAAETCTLLACTLVELGQLLDGAQAQLHSAAADTAGGGSAAEAQAPPALLLHLSLPAADGRPSAALHLLYLPASQGAAAEQQQDTLLRLLQEAADLHQRHREGEYRCAGGADVGAAQTEGR